MVKNVLAKRCIVFLLVFALIAEVPAVYVNASNGENAKSENKGWFSNIKTTITETWFGEIQENILNRKEKFSEQEGSFGDRVEEGWKIAS